MGLLIKSGRVIDPSQKLDGEADVLLVDGRVSVIERGLGAGSHEVLDASDKVVCPGFIDVHVHLREPGQEYKETIATGTRSAAAGGFAHVCCMPNTDPAIDDPSVVELLQVNGDVPDTGLVVRRRGSVEVDDAAGRDTRAEQAYQHELDLPRPRVNEVAQSHCLVLRQVQHPFAQQQWREGHCRQDP